MNHSIGGLAKHNYGRYRNHIFVLISVYGMTTFTTFVPPYILSQLQYNVINELVTGLAVKKVTHFYKVKVFLVSSYIPRYI